jgi:hypothetical protein
MTNKQTLCIFLMILLICCLSCEFGNSNIANADTSFSKPSIPEFTAAIVDHSDDYYTYKRLEITITNQPSPNQLQYSIRRSYDGQNWKTLYLWEDCPNQSDSQYTHIAFDPQGYSFGDGNIHIDAWLGSKIYFQVEAFVGGNVYVPPKDGNPIGSGWFYKPITESGWSDTQTITIDGNIGTEPTTRLEPTQSPAIASNQPSTQRTEVPEKSLTIVATVTAVIAVALIVIIAVMRRTISGLELRIENLERK